MQLEKVLEKGMHLITGRGTAYTHHGVYLGDEKVIHYAGWSKPFQGGKVEIVSLEEFHDGMLYYPEKGTEKKFSYDDAIKRAKTRLGENKYSLLFNNCEHFARWATEGVHRCNQWTGFMWRWSTLIKEQINISETRRKLIQNEYEKSLPLINKLDGIVDKLIDEKMDQYIDLIENKISSLTEAMFSEDSDQAIKEINLVLEKFDKKLQFSSQSDFDSLMNSQAPLKI